MGSIAQVQLIVTGRIIDWLRLALSLVLEQETAIGRQNVRERCSFHLMAPMTEAYFFGEAAALKRAGAMRNPSRFDRQVCDPEAFTVADSRYLGLADLWSGDNPAQPVRSFWSGDR